MPGKSESDGTLYFNTSYLEGSPCQTYGSHRQSENPYCLLFTHFVLF